MCRKDLNGKVPDSSGDDGDSSNSERSSSTKKMFRKLNKLGRKVDVETCKQLKKTVGVDIRMLRPAVQEDLRVYEEVRVNLDPGYFQDLPDYFPLQVDVKDHPSLAEACLKSENAEIDRS